MAISEIASSLMLLAMTNKQSLTKKDFAYDTIVKLGKKVFYILYGQDDFSRHQSLAEIKEQLGSPELLSVNTTVLDGQHLTLDQLKNSCNTMPFLAPKRLVIVEGLLKRFEPRLGKGRRDRRLQVTESEVKEWQALRVYVTEMPTTTILILADSQISKRNPLLAALSPVAKLMKFPLLKGNSLRHWIQKEVARSGGTISPEVVSLLAELIGGDLWTMRNEIEKLVLYSLGHSITEADVRQLAGDSREVNVFALVDAILDGKIQLSQRLLHRLFQEGTPASYLLVMITRQLRLVVRAKELVRELSRQQIQDKLGLTSNYGLDKTLKQASIYTLERLTEVYHKLLETDLAIKTGKYNGELALDLLVAELCQTAKV